MTEYSNELFNFIEENLNKQPDKLLLAYSGKLTFDIKLAVSTIEGRKKMLKKMPEWANKKGLVFPNKLCTEQCSSYQTAKFKQRFFHGASVVIDLTGGIGVDAFYASQVASKVIIVEKDPLLVKAIHHNFKLMDRTNVSIYNSETSKSTITGILEKAFEESGNHNKSIIYIDPSRRGSTGDRIYSITDYEPNILEILDVVKQFTSSFLVKISPMADITRTINQLGGCSGVYVISVYNECKELLFFFDRSNIEFNSDNVPIEAWNYKKNGEWESVNWTIEEERETLIDYKKPLTGMYLYEPNTSIIKAGGFKIIAKEFNLSKVSINSHLYLSENLESEFQGRKFQIVDIYNFDKKGVKKISELYPKASVAVRNFSMTSDELRSRLKIEEGDEYFIFGTLLLDNLHKIIICKKA